MLMWVMGALGNSLFALQVCSYWAAFRLLIDGNNLGNASGTHLGCVCEGKESTMNKQAVEQKWKMFCLHIYLKTRKVGDMKAGYSLGCSDHEMELRILSGGNKTKSRITIMDLK